MCTCMGMGGWIWASVLAWLPLGPGSTSLEGSLCFFFLPAAGSEQPEETEALPASKLVSMAVGAAKSSRQEMPPPALRSILVTGSGAGVWALPKAGLQGGLKALWSRDVRRPHPPTSRDSAPKLKRGGFLDQAPALGKTPLRAGRAVAVAEAGDPHHLCSSLPSQGPFPCAHCLSSPSLPSSSPPASLLLLSLFFSLFGQVY